MHHGLRRISLLLSFGGCFLMLFEGSNGEEVAGPIFDRGLVTEDAHISMRPQYSSRPGDVSLKLNLLVKSLWDRYNSSIFTTNDHALLLTYMWFIIRFSGEGSYSILPRITSKSCIHTLNRIYLSWRWSVAASGLRQWPGIAGRPRALQGALQRLAWKGMNVVWKSILESQAMGFQTWWFSGYGNLYDSIKMDWWELMTLPQFTSFYGRGGTSAQKIFPIDSPVLLDIPFANDSPFQER